MSAAAEAVATPETSQSTATPPGRVSFAKALEQARASEQPRAAKPAPEDGEQGTEAVVPTKEPEQAAVKKEAAKPKSALDALLSGKQPDPKAEAAPAPEDPLKDFPADAKERNYAGLRKKAEDGWARARELEKKLAEPDPKITVELESLRQTVAEREAALKERDAKLAEYKDSMVAVNIELDPDYRREFIDGRKQLVAGAGAKLKAYGGDEAALTEALALPEGRRRDDAIEAVMSDLGETAKIKIMRAVSDIESLDERRAAILANPQTSFEELKRKHEAQAQAQTEQSESVKKATFDKIARELAASVPTLGYADDGLEGGKEWNAARAANNAAALALLGNDTTSDQIVSASIKAADYDRLAGMFMEARKTIAEQAGRLSEYESAHPNTTGRKIPAPTKEQEAGKRTYTEILRSLKTDDDF